MRAGRHDPLAAPRPRRSPDARPEGQLLGSALHDRPLRRLARDQRRRLRRGARAGARAPAEDHPLRRLGVSAHGRDVGVPPDRRRGRRAALVRHGALRRARRRRPASRTRSSDCDFVTSTTHKTLAGPRAGFVLCREEHAPAIDRAVFPGMQGGPLEHVIAAKATCFRIAATEAFREYQRQVRANADALAAELIAGGLDVLTGGTDTHLLQLDLRGGEWTGKDAEERLHEVKADDEPQHRPVRRAAADDRVGRPPRHAGRDDARVRRGRLPRGRAGSSCGALSDDADIPALRGRSEALCERRPLYPGFRGFPTYGGEALRAVTVTRSSDSSRDQRGHRGAAPARPAQARPAARRHDDDADVPPARERAHPPPHLRGDEGPRRRGGRDRDAARATTRRGGSRARRSRSARSCARASGCSTASSR